MGLPLDKFSWITIIIGMDETTKTEKLSEKDIKIAGYLDQGLTVTDTARLVGLTRTRTSQIKNHKLNRYKLSLDTKLLKKTGKATHKIVDDYLTGELLLDGKTPAVKPSDVLRIVEMQQDRIDPKMVDNSQPTGHSFTQVNVNLEFLNGLKLVENDGQNSGEIDAKTVEIDAKVVDCRRSEAGLDSSGSGQDQSCRCEVDDPV